MIARRQLLLGSAGVGAIAVAVAIAVVATRGDDQPMASSGGHDHAAMASGGGSSSASVSLSAAQASRIGVTYAIASLEPLSREIRTVGQITFDERRVKAIAPKVDGWVETLHVNYTGQPVAAGQPLLEIYSPMLVQAQEELLLARRLAADVSAGSPDARGSASDLLASARRRLAYWDIPASDIAAIERSGEVRRTMTLRAPVGGYVLEKNVLAGQRIMSGEALYRVADLGVLWVEGEVFEQDLAAVRVGQTVHVDLQALPGVHHMGRITYIYPTLNSETRTARVRVELANPGLRLKPGMYATIRIEGGASRLVLTVPRSAVLVTGERNIVFVRATDGRLVPRDVRVGTATTDRVEILGGLSAGETVVSSATFLIDAESNLGAALGAPSEMPAPAGGPAMKVQPPAPPSTPATSPSTPPADPHAGHTQAPVRGGK